MYSSICFIPQHLLQPSGNPRAADMLAFVPKEHYRIITAKAPFLTHDGYDVLLEHGLTHDQIGFYTNTYHDSDSAKDWNPMYRVVARGEAGWRCKGLTWDPVTREHSVPCTEYEFEV